MAEVGSAAKAVVTSVMSISFGCLLCKGYLHENAYAHPLGHIPGEYKFTALTRSLATILVVLGTALVVDKLASDLIVEFTKTEAGAVACEGG